MTDVSAVIVNYNSRVFLRRCLDSLRRYPGGFKVEVTVVDNASSEKVDGLAAEFPEVRFHFNEFNLGYARANNQALCEARGKYALLLNPDVVLHENTLRILVDYLEGHPEAGAVGPKLLRADGRLDLACRRSFPTPLSSLYKLTGVSRMFPRNRHFSDYNLTFSDNDRAMEVDALCGACMAAPTSVLRDVGYFDEDFFLYGEDLDLAYRIKERGRRIVYLPAATALHVKRASTSTDRRISVREFHRSMLIFYRKHYLKRYPLMIYLAVAGAVYLRYGAAALTRRIGEAAEGVKKAVP